MSTTSTPITGVPLLAGQNHPHWSDGAPILCGDDVQHRTGGYDGYVTGVYMDEVLVAWWIEPEGDITDPEEYAPTDLIRLFDAQT